MKGSYCAGCDLGVPLGGAEGHEGEGFWSRQSDVAYMGGYQNSGPFLGTLNIRCRIIIGIQKGTIILTTIHLYSNLTPQRGPPFSDYNPHGA